MVVVVVVVVVAGAGAGAAGAAGARARTTLDARVVRPSRGTVEELAASRELGP